MLGPFFQIRWLRRLIRANMKPIPEHKAAAAKRKLAFFYAFFAWNAAGLCLYQVFKGNPDFATYSGMKSEEDAKMSPAQHYIKTHGVKKATVYRMEGLHFSSYEVGGENDEEKNAQSDIDVKQ